MTGLKIILLLTGLFIKLKQRLRRNRSCFCAAFYYTGKRVYDTCEITTKSTLKRRIGEAGFVIY